VGSSSAVYLHVHTLIRPGKEVENRGNGCVLLHGPETVLQLDPKIPMTNSADEREGRVLSLGNRTSVVLPHGQTGSSMTIVKQLLCFANVSPERQALYKEALLQRLAQGPGVVPVVDIQFIEVSDDAGAVEPV
jgi:hypothetical protein